MDLYFSIHVNYIYCFVPLHLMVTGLYMYMFLVLWRYFFIY